ncbi:site-specific integrase [Siphonobacter sp. SORGH_AS_0500]|uniref:site-specific integrase n=1 Tax=Siphonobacter sp. SORGH_AS_0500 TaxID=1864824 RepID=UPI00286B28FE|nr:site-specific integrase [Siphonobacter sp. SORGH_AS_0500]
MTLTQLEVNRLLHMPQQENFMENVRGKFLFLIFNGMRFSDLQRMGDGNIVQMGEFRLLRYTQVKTKEVVTIALSDYAEEIIDRWPDLFNPMSEQAFNSKIKDVCKEAGIKELVNVTTYKGGQRVQEQKPKWQTVSSHVGRHTHGVLSIERGLHTRLLQDNFGHGSLSSTQVYTKVNDLERYKATLEAWKRPENEVTK